jgi:hypothetical protein
MSEAFRCTTCGAYFQSFPPPAETRRDDPSPTCSNCLDKMLQGIDAEPLSEDTIARIVSRVTQRGE